ncbi:MAG: hypothetical protein AABM31_05125 [Actinomycetota bacterium]
MAPRSGPAVSARDRAVEGMVAHLDELQRIAGEHGGNRAAGTPGDRASVAYVAHAVLRRRRHGHRDGP